MKVDEGSVSVIKSQFVSSVLNWKSVWIGLNLKK